MKGEVLFYFFLLLTELFQEHYIFSLILFLNYFMSFKKALYFIHLGSVSLLYNILLRIL